MIKHLTLGLASPDPEPALTALTAPLYNDFFQEFMQICIDKVQNQVTATLKAKEEVLNRLLKARNPDLYYGISYIKYYLFI